MSFITGVASVLRNKIIIPLRRASPWFDQIFGKFSRLACMLFGTPGSSRKEVLLEFAKRRASMRALQEMADQIGDATYSICLTRAKATLYSSRLCDINEFETTEFRRQFQELHQDPSDIHRKLWEKAAVALLAKSLDYCNDQSRGLGLGVARENLPFFFSNTCSHIVGIDLYQPRFADGAGVTIDDVYRAAPFGYRRDRLQLTAMDMRVLEFPDSYFDFVWSISTVEHVNSVEEEVRVFQEIERVLRPGGHAFITTEWNMVAHNPVYEPGAIWLDEILYCYLMSKLKQLSPASPLHLPQPYHPDHFCAVNSATASGEDARPCVNIFSRGTFVTPALLVLRKRQ